PEVAAEYSPARSIQALEMTAKRAGTLFGGRRFSGTAIDSDGLLADGTFLSIGPVVLFSVGSGLSGLAQGAATPQPLLFHIPHTSANISPSVGTGIGLIPIDPPQGDALRVAASRDTVRQRIEKGGLWIWPILCFGLAALLVTVLKACQILRIKGPTASAV